jgi:hypothetical protein
MSDQLADERAGERFDLERETLDKPGWLATDWGGDGTDLTRPVRAHMLAALRLPAGPYPAPVNALRALGEPRAEDVDDRRRATPSSTLSRPSLGRWTAWWS